MLFGEESEGEGISNSLWEELSKFIGGLGVGKKGDGDQTESCGGVVFGEESVGEGGEDVVDVLDKGVSILGWPFWREFLSTVWAWDWPEPKTRTNMISDMF